MPGVTHLPRASIICAPCGMPTLRPAAAIRPLRMMTTPPGIGSEPSPSATVPPVIAMVWAAAGSAAAASSAAISGADHFTSPSPGWPSSKSLTGRRRGLPLKYIRAPSIQTRSGRA